jgi:TonB family protein
MSRLVLCVALVLCASTVEASSPNRALIQRPIQKRRGELKRCYEELLARKPKARGRVTVRFTIDRRGHSTDVRLERNEPGGGRFGRCVARVFGTLRYPSAPEPMHITYPLVFQPQS